jgi:hypothetical protein
LWEKLTAGSENGMEWNGMEWNGMEWKDIVINLKYNFDLEPMPIGKSLRRFIEM